MAITTQDTYLIYKKQSTYENLVDIKSFPDLGTAPGTVDVTTLRNACKVYLRGLIDTGALEFTANYDKADFAKLKALTGVQHFGVQFGKDGKDGVFLFDGELTVTVNGGGVEEAVEMTVSIVVSSELTVGESGATITD